MIKVTFFCFPLFECFFSQVIHLKYFYASLGTEIFRICRGTTGFNKFKLCETLILRMINQGGAKLKPTD